MLVRCFCEQSSASKIKCIWFGYITTIAIGYTIHSTTQELHCMLLFIYSLYVHIIADSGQPKVKCESLLVSCIPRESLGSHTHDMLDHVPDAIKDVMVVVVSLPHEGWSADHLVFLVHIGLVRWAVKGKNFFFLLS